MGEEKKIIFLNKTSNRSNVPFRKMYYKNYYYYFTHSDNSSMRKHLIQFGKTENIIWLFPMEEHALKISVIKAWKEHIPRINLTYKL